MVLVALSAVTSAQNRDAGTVVLDLTKPVPREQQPSGIPGASVGVDEGGKWVPPLYSLPLAVELRSISPQAVKPLDKFAVELTLRNTGDAVFRLPASRNSVKVLKQGNTGRRSFLFSLILEDPNTGKQTSSVSASTDGSDTVPASWLRVEPSQVVRVLFTADLYPIDTWVIAGLKQVRVRAQVSEWKYEDKRYFIETEAEPVVSQNTIVLDLAPPN